MMEGDPREDSLDILSLGFLTCCQSTSAIFSFLKIEFAYPTCELQQHSLYFCREGEVSSRATPA